MSKLLALLLLLSPGPAPAISARRLLVLPPESLQPFSLRSQRDPYHLSICYHDNVKSPHRSEGITRQQVSRSRAKTRIKSLHWNDIGQNVLFGIRHDRKPVEVWDTALHVQSCTNQRDRTRQRDKPLCIALQDEISLGIYGIFQVRLSTVI